MSGLSEQSMIERLGIHDGNIHFWNPYQRRDLCKRLGVNTVALKEAIAVVGPKLPDVKLHLIERIRKA